MLARSRHWLRLVSLCAVAVRRAEMLLLSLCGTLRLLLQPTPCNEVHAPRFPKQKIESWFLVVGDPKKNKLCRS